MTSELRWPPGELRGFASRILMVAGLAEDDAEAIAHGLVLADQRGVDSHGLARLPQYVATLAAGRVNPRPEVRLLLEGGAAVGLVDADGGYGYGPSHLAVERAIAYAQAHGIGAVGVRNSHHFGMAAPYVMKVAAQSMIGYVTTTTSPRLTPPGTVEPAVGNNPIAWAIPRRAPAPAIVLDMALSTVAFGKIRLAAAEGEQIPLGWGLDRDGNPTTDARAALESGMLDAIGGYKGYGLSVISEVLAGCLTGSPFGLGASAHTNPEGGVGHLFIVLDPARFGDIERFHDRVDQLAKEIKGRSRGSGGNAPLLPGEREAALWAERADAVPLDSHVAARLEELANALDVSPLARFGQGTRSRGDTP